MPPPGLSVARRRPSDGDGRAAARPPYGRLPFRQPAPPSRPRRGFPRRLRALGHLFGAEDESQRWPDLHTATRHVRKAYQADGTMPDAPRTGGALQTASAPRVVAHGTERPGLPPPGPLGLGLPPDQALFHSAKKPEKKGSPSQAPVDTI